MTDAKNEAAGGASASNAGLCGCELAGWEYSTFYGDNTVTPGWSAWERVSQAKMLEIEEYIAQGYKYRLRTLYAKAHNAR